MKNTYYKFNTGRRDLKYIHNSKNVLYHYQDGILVKRYYGSKLTPINPRIHCVHEKDLNQGNFMKCKQISEEEFAENLFFGGLKS